MPVNEQHTDELLQLAATGEQVMFTRLVHLYWEITYQFVYPYLQDHQASQEVVQDIFLQLWFKRQLLLKVTNFKSYLFIIARNRALNAVRSKVRERKKLKSWEQFQQQQNNIEMSSSEDALVLIDKAVSNLPPQQQQVWIMSRRQGKKYSEIASILHISSNAVKRYAHLANASIIKHLHSRLDLIILVFLTAFERYCTTP